MSEWKPIDSAPKDGTQILGYGLAEWQSGGDSKVEADPARSKLHTLVIFWDAPQEWEYRTQGRWLSVSNNPYNDVVSPTHWMPLPEAPK